jgi:hypothetical protein
MGRRAAGADLRTTGAGPAYNRGRIRAAAYRPTPLAFVLYPMFLTRKDDSTIPESFPIFAD